MNDITEALEKVKKAALQVWNENPGIQSQYRDFEAFFESIPLISEVREQWMDPQIRAELAGDFQTFLAFKRAEIRGDVRIIGGKITYGRPDGT